MILSKPNRVHWLGLVALLLCGASAYAQSDTVLLKRAAELREAPNDSARSLAALADRTPVTRSGARQGAWIQVRTEQGASGWVHMFDVGPASGASAPASAGASALRGLTNFLNRGSAQGATTTATSTIGIRGLGAEDLNRSQPSMEAVAQADALRLDAGEARSFASGAALTPRTVDPLPEPVAAPMPANEQNRSAP